MFQNQRMLFLFLVLLLAHSSAFAAIPVTDAMKIFLVDEGTGVVAYTEQARVRGLRLRSLQGNQGQQGPGGGGGGKAVSKNPSVAPFTMSPSRRPSAQPTLKPTGAPSISTQPTITPHPTGTPTVGSPPSRAPAVSTNEMAVPLTSFNVTVNSQAGNITSGIEGYLLLGFQSVYSNAAAVDLSTSSRRLRRLTSNTTTFDYSGQVWFHSTNNSIPSESQVQSLQYQLLSDTSSLNAALGGSAGAIVASVQMPAPGSASSNSAAGGGLDKKTKGMIGGIVGGVSAVALVVIIALYQIRQRQPRSGSFEEVQSPEIRVDDIHVDDGPRATEPANQSIEVEHRDHAALITSSPSVADELDDISAVQPTTTVPTEQANDQEEASGATSGAGLTSRLKFVATDESNNQTTGYIGAN